MVGRREFQLGDALLQGCRAARFFLFLSPCATGEVCEHCLSSSEPRKEISHVPPGHRDSQQAEGPTYPDQQDTERDQHFMRREGEVAPSDATSTVYLSLTIYLPSYLPIYLIRAFCVSDVGFVPAAMASSPLHVWMVSGSEVASIPKEELSDVRSLKQRLQTLSGLPRFRQGLLLGGRVLDDSEILQTSDLQLVLLPYAETSQHEEDKLAASAAFGCFSEIERMLLQRHDPNVVDSTLGLSPLYYASERGHLEIVRLLLEACADADYGARRHDITPLLAASRNGRVDIAKLLLQAGADKHRCNCRGETPLWVASCRGNTDIVRFLLGAGLNIDQADNSGETPLCVACRFGREEIVCLLRQAGSDIFRTNKRGDSPLSLAVGQRTGPVCFLLCCWRPALALLSLLRSRRAGQRSRAQKRITACFQSRHCSTSRRYSWNPETLNPSKL